MQSLQERYFPGMTCFGCGPGNPDGLHLQSFAADGGTRATFRAWPQHDNGLGYVNGGIISTVLDCHSVTPLMTYADANGLLAAPGTLPFVTAGLDIRFVRPTPLGPELTLWATIDSVNEEEAFIDVELSHDDKVRATARAHWKRWRPRV
jgi:acyl-coenzyme A thioesterase PaaI-like protein